jgi:hypothetical protein
MKPEYIKDAVDRRPFVPFRIRLADGSNHVIHHPELIWITANLIGVASGIDHATAGIPAKALLCAPEHIVSVELLNRSRSKAA